VSRRLPSGELHPIAQRAHEDVDGAFVVRADVEGDHAIVIVARDDVGDRLKQLLEPALALIAGCIAIIPT